MSAPVDTKDKNYLKSVDQTKTSDDFLLSNLYLRLDEKRWHRAITCEEDTLP